MDSQDNATSGGNPYKVGKVIVRAFAQKPFWIFMVVVSIAGVVYWVYRVGKRVATTEADIPFTDVPNDKAVLTSGFKQSALNDCAELYRLTKGIDWWISTKTWPGKEALYRKMMAYNEIQLRYVSNVWLQKYWSLRGENMHETIDDDQGGGTFKEGILERLKQYGLQ